MEPEKSERNILNGNAGASIIEGRKADHVEISLKENVQASYNYWDDIRLVHNALPEVDLDDVNTRVRLFEKELEAPIIISAMTGGFGKSEEINRNLAKAAERLGLGMGVGSQRAALEDGDLVPTYAVLLEHDIPLRIANLGLPQLVEQDGKDAYGYEEAVSAMEMIDADILAVHLNYLQEIVQPEGDHRAAGTLDALKRLALRVPVLAKETGAGITRDVAVSLKQARIKGIDVGGLGGTTFSGVEVFRARSTNSKVHEQVGQTFWNWGVPTPVSVLEADVGLPLVATGGVRNGLDVARALVLGAEAGGMAGHLLKAAVESADAVTEVLETVITELKTAMFLMGAGSVSELKGLPYVTLGPTRMWLDGNLSRKSKRSW